MGKKPDAAALLSLITQHAPVTIVVLDRDGVFLDIVGDLARRAGFDPAAAIGQPALTYLARDPERVHVLRRALAGETVAMRFTANGLWVETVYVPVLDTAGAVDAVVGIAVDVTQQHEVEETAALLAESQRSAHLGNWTLDLTTDELTWSDEVFRIFEIDRARFGASYDAFLAAVHPDDAERVNEAYTRSLTDRRPYVTTHRLRMADGRIKWVEERAESDFAADGTPLVSRGTVQDVTDRERALRTLREAEAKFSVTFHRSPVAMGLRRLSDAVIVDVNEAWERLFETRRELAVGKTVAPAGASLHHEEREALRRTLGEPGGAIRSRRMQFIRRGGARAHVLMSAEPVTIAGERFALTSFVDLGPILEAEQKVATSARRFDGLMANTTDGVFLSNREGQYLDANPAAVAMLGYTRERLRSMTIADLIAGESTEQALSAQNYRRVIEGESQSRTLRLRRGDGAVRWFALTASKIDDDTMVGIVRDIHDEHEEAEAARELAEIVQASPLSIVTIDERGVVLSANPATERTFGFRSADLVGQNVAVLTADIPVATHDGFIERYLATGEASTVDGLVIGRTREVRARRADGTEFPAELTVTDIEHHDGRHRFVGILLDRTEWHEQEAHLLRMQRLEAVGTLAAGIAHDFNNLLTGILGGVDMARTTTGASRWLDVATESAERAAALVQSLLRFSRREAPRRTPNTPTALGTSVLRLVRETLDRRIWIETSFADDLDDVLADANQIEQVLLNLIVNARDAVLARADHSEADYRPTIGVASAAREHGGRRGVLFTVEDNGVGMDDEVRRRALDPFFTTKPVDQGTGLGLAMASGVIDAHGGWFNLDSTPGIGTRASFWLPSVTEGTAVAAPDALPASGAGATGATERKRVLVVDDEALVGEVAAAYLVAGGYAVTTVTGGALAIELSRTEHFDLVLTDLNMPQPNGWDVLAAFREREPNTPVIITSGHVRAEEVLERGGSGLLDKPFGRDALLAMVGRVLHQEAP